MTEPRSSRLAAGHTQAQAAELLGVRPRTVQDWEAGISDIPPLLLRVYRHLTGLERIPFGEGRRQGDPLPRRGPRVRAA